MTKKLNLVGKLVSDSYGFSLDKSENRSEGATRVTFQKYIRLDQSENTVKSFTCDFELKLLGTFSHTLEGSALFVRPGMNNYRPQGTWPGRR